ncbi:MAG TPA: CPBP family intramembrane glutamic endopeptidase [Acidothermaceae bacterium]|nr:CPBP family intramembrane glutamic endopeptidase [Acidothermaceae bacterium]
MAPPTDGATWSASRWHRVLVIEVWIVFAISLGASGVGALLDLINDLTVKHVALSSQHTTLNGSVTPDRPWLDLAFQLFGIATGLVPVALVIYLLHRSNESLRTIGVDRTRPARDLGVGALLAACVGGAGLALYIGAHAAGANVVVVPTTLGPHWWRIPVLLLSAAQNGIYEEVIVSGYLLHRLRQFGWGDNKSLATSALIRGSYHLYQGFGGGLGNAVMGLIFGRVYQRTGRTLPLIIAHTLMDATTFIGYIYLAHKVSWLPT